MPFQVSPYVNGQTVDRLMTKQSDLVWAGLKSGVDAMRDFAQDVNEAIIEQLDPPRYPRLGAASPAESLAMVDNRPLFGEDGLGNVLADLLAVDVEGGNQLDITDVIPAELHVHQAGDALVRGCVLVVLESLDKR